MHKIRLLIIAMEKHPEELLNAFSVLSKKKLRIRKNIDSFKAWEFQPANCSTLEWIQRKKPKDPTKAKKLNAKFADYKEKVIDLLMRVCRVSVETVGEMGEKGEEIEKI